MDKTRVAQEFGKELKQLRVRKGLSQERLALEAKWIDHFFRRWREALGSPQ